MDQRTTKDDLHQPVFELAQVSKTRDKGGNRFCLEIETLKVWPGEFVAIVGESGCGKSTLLDMLGLALKPSQAQQFIFRQNSSISDIAAADEAKLAAIRKSHLGYVLQTGGLLPFLTVKANIYLPCLLNQAHVDEAHIATLVQRLKIQDQLNKKPQFLSGGQRQRAAIARALAHRPPVVLADEPTAAVDKLTAEDIMNEFKRLTKKLDCALLMVTHDFDLVEAAADRVFTFDLKRLSETMTRSRCYETTRAAVRRQLGRKDRC